MHVAYSGAGGGGVSGDGPVDEAGLCEGGAAAAAGRCCCGKPGDSCNERWDGQEGGQERDTIKEGEAAAVAAVGRSRGGRLSTTVD